MKPEISIVIPVYRSQSILPELVKRLEAALSKQHDNRFEVVMVNDCSPDDSWIVLANLARSHHWLKAIDLRKNAGQHNAILCGLRYCTGQKIVMMDDDLQHSPDDIDALLEPLSNGYDVSYGEFRSKQHALWKRVGSKFNDIIAGILLGKPKGLYLSPFKAICEGVRDELVHFNGPNVYLDGLILNTTNKIATVKIDHHERADGQSGYGLRKSISLWLKMATGFSVAPLRIASLTGLAFSGLGFLAAVAFIIQRFTINAMPVGWSSLMVSAMILGGIQLLSIGIIGEYLGRVLLHVNGRQQTIVASTINTNSHLE